MSRGKIYEHYERKWPAWHKNVPTFIRPSPIWHYDILDQFIQKHELPKNWGKTFVARYENARILVTASIKPSVLYGIRRPGTRDAGFMFAIANHVIHLFIKAPDEFLELCTFAREQARSPNGTDALARMLLNLDKHLPRKPNGKLASYKAIYNFLKHQPAFDTHITHSNTLSDAMEQRVKLDEERATRHRDFLIQTEVEFEKACDEYYKYINTPECRSWYQQKQMDEQRWEHLEEHEFQHLNDEERREMVAAYNALILQPDPYILPPPNTYPGPFAPSIDQNKDLKRWYLGIRLGLTRSIGQFDLTPKVGNKISPHKALPWAGDKSEDKRKENVKAAYAHVQVVRISNYIEELERKNKFPKSICDQLSDAGKITEFLLKQVWFKMTTDPDMIQKAMDMRRGRIMAASYEIKCKEALNRYKMMARTPEFRKWYERIRVAEEQWVRKGGTIRFGPFNVPPIKNKDLIHKYRTHYLNGETEFSPHEAYPTYADVRRRLFGKRHRQPRKPGPEKKVVSV